MIVASLSLSCCNEWFQNNFLGIQALVGNLPDLSNGTPLRSAFKFGREKLNSVLVDTSEKREYAAQRWDEIRMTAKAHTAMTFARLGVDYSDAENFNDFRRMHPHLLISGRKQQCWVFNIYPISNLSLFADRRGKSGCCITICVLWQTHPRSEYIGHCSLCIHCCLQPRMVEEEASASIVPEPVPVIAFEVQKKNGNSIYS